MKIDRVYLTKRVLYELDSCVDSRYCNLVPDFEDVLSDIDSLLDSKPELDDIRGLETLVNDIVYGWKCAINDNYM